MDSILGRTTPEMNGKPRGPDSLGYVDLRNHRQRAPERDLSFHNVDLPRQRQSPIYKKDLRLSHRKRETANKRPDQLSAALSAPQNPDHRSRMRGRSVADVISGDMEGLRDCLKSPDSPRDVSQYAHSGRNARLDSSKEKISRTYNQK